VPKDIGLEQQEKYWDKVSIQKEFPVPFHGLEFEKFVSLEMSILDVGCGYGRTLGELSQKGYSNLIGVDISQGMIDRARHTFPNLRFVKMNGKELSFSKGSLDSVILLSLLTCMASDEAQKQLMGEVRRVLRDGGILYLSDFLLNTDKRNIERYEKYLESYGCYGVFELPEGGIVRHHTRNHILELLDGFQLLFFNSTLFPTMNGHHSNGFYLMARKRN
jgi:ubiquinone/menaquinone biosynthesis C-methylase UbiE